MKKTISKIGWGVSVALLALTFIISSPVESKADVIGDCPKGCDCSVDYGAPLGWLGCWLGGECNAEANCK